MAERRADVATRRGSAATIDDLPKQLLTHTDTCTCTYVYVHVPLYVCVYIERYMYVCMIVQRRLLSDKRRPVSTLHRKLERFSLSVSVCVCVCVRTLCENGVYQQVVNGSSNIELGETIR